MIKVENGHVIMEGMTEHLIVEASAIMAGIYRTMTEDYGETMAELLLNALVSSAKEAVKNEIGIENWEKRVEEAEEC